MYRQQHLVRQSQGHILAAREGPSQHVMEPFEATLGTSADLFLTTFRGMPTANAEGLERIGGQRQDRSWGADLFLASFSGRADGERRSSNRKGGAEVVSGETRL